MVVKFRSLLPAGRLYGPSIVVFAGMPSQIQALPVGEACVRVRSVSLGSAERARRSKATESRQLLVDGLKNGALIDAMLWRGWLVTSLVRPA